jgi:probable phosphoglycerate mutase
MLDPMKELKQKVVLIRHGETEWALEGRHTSFTDLPLTEKGREEAGLLKGALKRWQFKQVFSSPLKRARNLRTGGRCGWCDRGAGSFRMELWPL